MYESPIELITTEIATRMEDDILRCTTNVIQKYGININEEELKRALAYDRAQYNAGFMDGKKAYDHGTGTWESFHNDIKNIWIHKCSHCEETFETETSPQVWTEEYLFCHRCGARMQEA